jgi:hypothetical protein
VPEQQEQHGSEQKDQPEASAYANSKFRTKGLQFIRSPPMDLSNAFLITRLGMEPLRVLLDKKLFIGSKRWELHQQACAAAPSPGSTWPHRQFSVSVAAANQLESAFFNQMSHLLNPDLWQAITNPTEARCHLKRSEKQ